MNATSSKRCGIRTLSRASIQKDGFYEEPPQALFLLVLGPSLVSLLDDDTESGKYLPLDTVKRAVGGFIGSAVLVL
jgi:hypothetical protein